MLATPISRLITQQLRLLQRCYLWSHLWLYKLVRVSLLMMAFRSLWFALTLQDFPLLFTIEGIGGIPGSERFSSR